MEWHGKCHTHAESLGYRYTESYWFCDTDAFCFILSHTTVI